MLRVLGVTQFKCTDYCHTQEQTPMYPDAPANRGRCAGPGCDCGTKPCGFYMYNHSAADVVVNNQTFRDWFLDDYIFHNRLVLVQGIARVVLGWCLGGARVVLGYPLTTTSSTTGWY